MVLKITSFGRRGNYSIGMDRGATSIRIPLVSIVRKIIQKRKISDLVAFKNSYKVFSTCGIPPTSSFSPK